MQYDTLNKLIYPKYRLRKWDTTNNSYHIYNCNNENDTIDMNNNYIGHIEYHENHAMVRKFNDWGTLTQPSYTILYSDPDYQTKVNEAIMAITKVN